ncbi:hypothetical protein ACFQRB_00640 [Halobaculum litoreum]|uniref:Uncharacterized protein n=1 Tax=Halobaculum litoreum TaxID=3031998 RepID=A0ABD5XPQ3_9EURY
MDRPPAGGSAAYLSAVEERDGVVVADNMHPDPRYVALDAETRRRAGGRVRLSVPGVDRTFPTILPESLTTSIQPHLQIPDASTLPAYHDYAVRTLGPVLALATNSPFLPADLYRDPDTGALADAETVMAGPHEHRVYVFEQAVNAGLDDAERKVRVPRDLDTAGASPGAWRPGRRTRRGPSTTTPPGPTPTRIGSRSTATPAGATGGGSGPCWAATSRPAPTARRPPATTTPPSGWSTAPSRPSRRSRTRSRSRRWSPVCCASSSRPTTRSRPYRGAPPATRSTRPSTTARRPTSRG